MVRFGAEDWLIIAAGGAAGAAVPGIVYGWWWISGPAALAAVVLAGCLLRVRARRSGVLIVTIGAPGSGKTTAARRWWAEDPPGRVMLDRDGLRAATGICGDQESNGQPLEDIITLGQVAAVVAWLRSGLDVAVPDTCQTQDVMDGWARIARRCRVRLVVWDYRAVPLGVCVERDRQRGARGGRLVGEPAIGRISGRCAEVVVPGSAVVREMAARYLGDSFG